MNMFIKLTVVFFALLATLPIAVVNATPIAYSLTLEVDTVLDGPGIFCYRYCDPVFQVGNLYFGFFVIDDAILQDDGVNQAGELSQFVIAIEDYLWSMNLPYPQSDFRGFLGPDGYYSSSPGFDVQDGEIVNLRGGVFGSSDYPFVDFGSGNNRFSAAMSSGVSSQSAGAIQGSLSLARIPEPSTLALLGLGLVGIGMARRKKKV